MVQKLDNFSKRNLNLYFISQHWKFEDFAFWKLLPKKLNFDGRSLNLIMVKVAIPICFGMYSSAQQTWLQLVTTEPKLNVKNAYSNSWTYQKILQSHGITWLCHLFKLRLSVSTYLVSTHWQKGHMTTRMYLVNCPIYNPIMIKACNL